MEDDYVEVIGVEQLKTILTTLSPKDIVRYAYEKWVACQRSGYTILNLETGKISGMGVEQNQLPLNDDLFIVLYTISALENPVKVEELLSEEEYDDYLDFKGDEAADYTPDILSDFCQKNNIDENGRKISILAAKFEENEYWNYNSWESGILNEYYDAIQEEHYTFKTIDEEI